MSEVSQYWLFNRLNNQGKVVVEEIAEAKLFIQQQCSDLSNQKYSSDTAMQHRLFALLQENQSTAEICLRCFISEQIKQVCLKVTRQFGESHQFNSNDLYPFVLDDFLDDLQEQKTNLYTPMAIKILQKFDPKQSSLSTWTTRLVRSNSELNNFLLERGVYLISDWAILNDIKPQQLERIFKTFYNFDDATITSASLLLTAYHQVYRLERLANRNAGFKGKCPDPSYVQLEKMARLTGLSISAEKMLENLKNLAGKLREYRIFIRGGKTKQDSFDNSDIQLKKVEQQLFNNNFEDSTEETDFLNRYRQQFFSCLKTAIAFVISKEVNRKKEPKKTQFINALKLFHCEGLSMTEIAPMIGLKAQFEVSRLMQLKNLRSDIQQKMLQDLSQQIKEMVVIYTNPDQLLQREQQINLALEGQITTVIEEAQAEARSVKNQPLKSILATYICNYFD